MIARPPRSRLASAEALEAQAKVAEARERIAKAKVGRKLAEQKLSIVGQATSYKNSSPSRLRPAGKRPRQGSADSHLDPRTAQDLRAACQALDRNNPLAEAMRRRLVDLVVGDGSVARAATEDTGWNARCDELFHQDWDGSYCDIRRMKTGAGLERDLVGALITDGDAAFVKIESKDSGGGLMAFEAERLVNPNSIPGSGINTQVMVSGIECDTMGRPVNYHFAEYSGDGSMTGKTAPVAAKDVLFLVNPIGTRLNQTRGVPCFASSIGRFEHLEKFDEATLVAARIQACSAFAIESENPTAMQGQMAGETVTRPDGTQERETEMSPGMMLYLNKGEKATALGPTQPNVQYSPYVMSQVQQIGAAVGLPIVLSMLDFSKVNFSAAKSACVIAYNGFVWWQDAIRTGFLMPVWQWKVGGYIRRGLLPFRADWWKHTWYQNPPAVLDPMGDLQAAAFAIEKGLGLREKPIAQHTGMPLGVFLSKREAEIKAETAAGLVHQTDPGAGSLNAPPPVPAPAKADPDADPDADPEADDSKSEQ